MQEQFSEMMVLATCGMARNIIRFHKLGVSSLKTMLKSAQMQPSIAPQRVLHALEKAQKSITWFKSAIMWRLESFVFYVAKWAWGAVLKLERAPCWAANLALQIMETFQPWQELARKLV